MEQVKAEELNRKEAQRDMKTRDLRWIEVVNVRGKRE